MRSLVYVARGCFPYCRAVATTDLVLATRRCVICFRAAAAHRLVGATPDDRPLLGHVETHGATDITAQLLFTGVAPIHGRCLPVWSDLLFHHGRLPAWREQWRLHCRHYAPVVVRWYQDMVQCVESGDAETLAHWPVPVAGRPPRPQEAIGALVHTALQQYWHYHTPSSTLPIRLSLAKRLTVGVPPPHPAPITTALVRQALPRIVIDDRDLFTPDGMYICLSPIDRGA